MYSTSLLEGHQSINSYTALVNDGTFCWVSIKIIVWYNEICCDFVVFCFLKSAF